MSDPPTTSYSLPAPKNRTGFPAYVVAAVSAKHVIVGGGGGCSNPSIFNGVAVGEVVYDKKEGYVVKQLLRHKMRQSPILNIALGEEKDGTTLMIVTGADESCRAYQVKAGGQEEEEEQQVTPGPSNPGPSGDDGKEGRPDADHGVRKRSWTLSNGEGGSGDGSLVETQDDAVIAPGEGRVGALVVTKKKEWDCLERQKIFGSKQMLSQFCVLDPGKNVVCFRSVPSAVISGAGDGMLRLWSLPHMKEVMSIKVSVKGISDVDVSPDGTLVVCIAEDGKCTVWSVITEERRCTLELTHDRKRFFDLKRCRFGIARKNSYPLRLFTIFNPKKDSGKGHSFIHQWAGNSFSLKEVARVRKLISVLAVSECGGFVATGSMEGGDVDIFDAHHLRPLKRIKDAHPTFVTGLAFLHRAQEGESVLVNDDEAALVSVSVNQILVHSVPRKRDTIPIWLAVIFVIFLQCIVYVCFNCL